MLHGVHAPVRIVQARLDCVEQVISPVSSNPVRTHILIVVPRAKAGAFTFEDAVPEDYWTPSGLWDGDLIDGGPQNDEPPFARELVRTVGLMRTDILTPIAIDKGHFQIESGAQAIVTSSLRFIVF